MQHSSVRDRQITNNIPLIMKIIIKKNCSNLKVIKQSKSWTLILRDFPVSNRPAEEVMIIKEKERQKVDLLKCCVLYWKLQSLSCQTGIKNTFPMTVFNSSLN